MVVSLTTAVPSLCLQVWFCLADLFDNFFSTSSILHSNLHGLWKGDTVDVPNAAVVEEIDCAVSNFPVTSWTSVNADFMRLQNAAFGSIIPFTEDTGGASHTPYITLNDDGTASVLVGKVGGDIHPMIASDDPEVVHWITEIYVQQNGDHIIAMSSLDPTGVNNATMNFNVPEGTETLRAFAWW